MIKKSMKLITFCLLMTFLFTACQKKDNNEGANTINIVATTTMLADLSRAIGGDIVTVNGLMGPGIDPHLYQASAGDVTLLQKADVIVYNGLHLEVKMGELLESLKEQGKTIISIEDGISTDKFFTLEDDSYMYDPHVWFEVSLWMDAAKHLSNLLQEADSKNAGIYKSNLDAYLVELTNLETYVKDRAKELSPQQRVLITAHDAFNYFGRAYDFEVKGLQGISTDSEAGTQDVSSLAEYIASNRIKAIFIESSVPPKTIEALQAAVKAKGFDVTIGGELYSDSLGDVESATETYIKTITHNIDTIVDALK